MIPKNNLLAKNKTPADKQRFFGKVLTRAYGAGRFNSAKSGHRPFLALFHLQTAKTTKPFSFLKLQTKKKPISAVSEGLFLQAKTNQQTNQSKPNLQILNKYHRSNQDTCLVHKPAVKVGEWVESGDLLADNSASMNGELAIGKNIIVAYMPWEGFNYEDAILINERLVYDDVYTSIHIERYEIQTKNSQFGGSSGAREQITREIPDINPESIAHLDKYGIASIGSWIEEGDILVGKVTPVNKKSQTPYQRLLFKLLDKTVNSVRDSSLRAPRGIKANIIHVQILAASTNDTKPTKHKNMSINLNESLKLVTNSGKVLNLRKTSNKKLKNNITKRKSLKQLEPYKKAQINNSMLHSLQKRVWCGPMAGIINNSKQNTFGLVDPSYMVDSGYPRKPIGSVPGFVKETFCFIKQNGFVPSAYGGNKTIKPKTSKTNQTKPKPTTARFAPPAQTTLQNVMGNKYAHVSPFKEQPTIAALPMVCPTNTKEKKHTSFAPVVGTILFRPTTAVMENKTKQLLGNPNRRGLFGLPYITYKKRYVNYVPLAIAGYAKNISITPSPEKHQKIERLSKSLKSNLNLGMLHQNKVNKSAPLARTIPTNVHIYLAEKRKIQVGDKMAGRHGNKGIISNILPRQDMPYLPDGTAVDIVLNPLGVPSRMNVGQIYECLLGLAGKYLGEHYKIFPFDEIYGAEASRSFVFAKLFEASKKTGIEWLFDVNSPGKIRLLDGRTGECFDQPITVGIAYMLKLVHMVDDKIHARSTGPYSLVTQQPLRGRAKQGGQRLGEMEVWAIEGYGAAFVLLEMLTLKSDDMTGRLTLWSNLILNKEITVGTPESFKVLVCELQALCLDIGLYNLSPSSLDKNKKRSLSGPLVSPNEFKEISHLMLLP